MPPLTVQEVEQRLGDVKCAICKQSSFGIDQRFMQADGEWRGICKKCFYSFPIYTDMEFYLRTQPDVPWGNIASVGLAQGPELRTTVMPFILRGVSLLGINSVEVPRTLRLDIWRRLGGDLKLPPAILAAIGCHETDLDHLHERFPPYVAGQVTGRTLVHLR